MSTPILICACIIALLLIFELSRIVTALVNIRITLDIITRNLAMLIETKRKNNPPKQREYWSDQNGFRHWRNKDA